MSLFPPALSFVLDNEDRQREYATVPDAGGFAISGINSHAWPQDFEFISAIPQEHRGPAVSAFYQTEYWDEMKLEGLDSQDLANRVMDMGVNGGAHESIELLQRAANTLGSALTVDGILGPVSTGALNALNEENLLLAFKRARLQHYQEIVDANPSRAQYLSAWEARATA